MTQPEYDESDKEFDEETYGEYSMFDDAGDAGRSNVLIRSLMFGMIVGALIAGVVAFFKGTFAYEIGQSDAVLSDRLHGRYYHFLILTFIELWVYFSLALFLGAVVYGAAEAISDRMDVSNRRIARMILSQLRENPEKRANRHHVDHEDEKTAQKIVEPLLRELGSDEDA